MINRFKSALASVSAPESLKAQTLQAIDAKRAKPRRTGWIRGLAISAACALALMVFTGVRAYMVQTAYVSLDVNPSIALSINDFGRVIDASAYGEASEAVLQSVSIKNETYEQAVEELLDSAAMQPYLSENSDLWIAVQANNPDTESRMEEQLANLAVHSMETHHQTVSVNSSTVTEEVRTTSQDQGMTASKYLAICELQEVDPEAAVDAYKDSTIGEIWQQRDECLDHAETGHVWHHAEAEHSEAQAVSEEPQAETEAAATDASDAQNADTDTSGCTSSGSSGSPGHHGSSGHHGNGHH